MANDRVYVKCAHCKESKLLYKYYPSGSYTWNPEELGEWFEKHEDCLNESAEYDMFLKDFSAENPLFIFLTEGQTFKLREEEEKENGSGK